MRKENLKKFKYCLIIKNIMVKQKQENENNLNGFIIMVIISGIILVFGILIFQYLGDLNVTTLTDSSQDNILYTNQSVQLALSGIDPTIISSSVSAYNNTFLAFDGVDDYVSRLITPSLNLTSLNNNFSLSLWVLVPNYSSSNSLNIISFRSSTLRGFGIQTRSLQRLEFIMRNDTASTSGNEVTNALTPNKWQLITASYNKDTNNMTLYVNNILIKNNTGVITSPPTTMYIGSDYVIAGTGGDFSGLIDEVRIYNRTLSDSEITEIYNSGLVANSSLPSTGLVAWYSFNEGTGTSAYDKSGNANTGTLVGFD